MAATVEQIRALREQTGAGIMDCKKALEENGADLDKAIAALRQKGFAQAARRADRETTEGVIEAYIHTGGRVGALVELGCETDFVARTPEFKQLAHDIAMQVADTEPVEPTAAEADHPASLLQQTFINDRSRSVSDIVQELAAKVGENVRVVRFSRLDLAESGAGQNQAVDFGVIEAYIHTGGRVGSLVELGCETDFVARTPEFKQLAHDIAMQIAAMGPVYLSDSDIAAEDDRPASQVCLLQQTFIKDSSRVVADIVQELAAKVGENVRVVRFSRLALEE